jgi:hypothetical protein
VRAALAGSRIRELRQVAFLWRAVAVGTTHFGCYPDFGLVAIIVVLPVADKTIFPYDPVTTERAEMAQ